MTVTVNEYYVETLPEELELIATLFVEHHGLARAPSRSFFYLRGDRSPQIFVSAPPTHEFCTLELQRIVSGITPLDIS